MSYIEFNSPTIAFGKSKVIIMLNGVGIDSFDIPAPNVAEKAKESLVRETNSFEYNDIIYTIEINSSNLGTYVVIETEYDTDDIYNFEIFIDTKQEFINMKQELEISLYVPALSYTNTTSAVLYGQINKNVIPLIDIETEDKFLSYLNDELIVGYKHLLDISSMKEITNKEERDKAKLIRKQEKKEFGKMNTLIPSPIEKFMQPEHKTNYLKEIIHKENVIPVFKWDENNANIDKLKSFVRVLMNEYGEIGIRVSEVTSFFENIEEISKIHDINLILDLNTNFNRTEIINYVKESIKYSFINIIYLGAQFSADDISISKNDTNKNLISTNQPLLVFNSIKQDDGIKIDIGFGDYCGFDKKTITELPSGGRGTARVVLSSIDNSMKLLVRRGWDENDISQDTKTGKTKVGYGHSMRKLLKDIAEGELDDHYGQKFMDENLCDADFSLKSYYPDITTPGMIKTLCFRHNIFSIIHNFIKN